MSTAAVSCTSSHPIKTGGCRGCQRHSKGVMRPAIKDNQAASLRVRVRALKTCPIMLSYTLHSIGTRPGHGGVLKLGPNCGRRGLLTCSACSIV